MIYAFLVVSAVYFFIKVNSYFKKIHKYKKYVVSERKRTGLFWSGSPFYIWHGKKEKTDAGISAFHTHTAHELLFIMQGVRHHTGRVSSAICNGGAVKAHKKEKMCHSAHLFR